MNVKIIKKNIYILFNVVINYFSSQSVCIEVGTFSVCLCMSTHLCVRYSGSVCCQVKMQ